MFFSSARAVVQTIWGSRSQFSYFGYGAGSNDGAGTLATFTKPTAVTVTSDGRIIILESKLRSISPAGVVTTLSNIAGFNNNVIYGLASSSSGIVFVAGGGGIIQAVSKSGLISDYIGSNLAPYGSFDGNMNQARFSNIGAIAMNANGTMVVTDNSNLIRIISTAGIVSTIAGNPSFQLYSGMPNDGVGTQATFAGLTGVAITDMGVIYAIENGGYAAQLRKITPSGVVTTIASTGPRLADGIGGGNIGRTAVLRGITLTPEGTIVTVDVNSNSLLAITTSGVVSILAGNAQAGSVDGIGTQAGFDQPNGVASSASGTLIVVDYNSNVVRTVTPVGALGCPTGGTFGTADSNSCSVCRPGQVCGDASGSKIICELIMKYTHVESNSSCELFNVFYFWPVC